jgi:hypothetical protein
MTTIDVKASNAVRIIQHGEGLDRHYRKVAMHVNGTYYTATANAKNPDMARERADSVGCLDTTDARAGQGNWLAATATPAHFRS